MGRQVEDRSLTVKRRKDGELCQNMSQVGSGGSKGYSSAGYEV